MQQAFEWVEGFSDTEHHLLQHQDIRVHLCICWQQWALQQSSTRLEEHPQDGSTYTQERHGKPYEALYCHTTFESVTTCHNERTGMSLGRRSGKLSPRRCPAATRYSSHQ